MKFHRAEHSLKGEFTLTKVPSMSNHPDFIQIYPGFILINLNFIQIYSDFIQIYIPRFYPDLIHVLSKF